MNPTLLKSRCAALVAPLLACLAVLPMLMLMPAGAQAATTRGSGVVATESRSVGEFQALASSASIDLVVRQGAQAIEVQADDNLLPLLETVVEPGSNGPTLHVRWKKGHDLSTRSKVMVSVTTPRLVALAGSGSGDIRLEAFNTPALKISMSGSGDVTLARLTSDDLDIVISGSSDVTGSGRATRLRIAISGSGDVALADMQAEDVTIRINGSGDATVNAQKSLAARIVGSGDVLYTGSPALQVSVTGSGAVRKR